jgi:hypothetical protein
MGVYRRLCQCYTGLQFGELSGELYAQQNQASVASNPEAQFKLTGLPEELNPLGKSFKEGVKPEKIDTWEDWYKAVGLPLSSPVAVVFEYPLTLFYVIKKYAAKRMEGGECLAKLFKK